MIQAVLSDGISKAGEMLFNNNPLSIVCSLICDHEKQCEGHSISKSVAEVIDKYIQTLK